MGERDTESSNELEQAVYRDIDEILSEHFEVSEKLNRLRELEIGRAFEHVKDDKRILLGYSLPLNREQTNHVVVFADGEVIVTEPNGAINNLIYSNYLGSSNAPFLFDTPDLSSVKRAFNLENVLKSKVTLRSSDKEQLPAIKNLLKDALEMGMILKREREEALKESPQVVVDIVDSFLDTLDAPGSSEVDPETY